MATIYQSGNLNTTALTVPGLYVQIVPPSVIGINGASTGTIGIVGTAAWGPVGSAVTVGSMGDYTTAFGAKQALTTDMGVAVNAALLQFASDFVCVRVTDGTDVAATTGVAVGAGNMAISARYTGAVGNSTVFSVSETTSTTMTATATNDALGISEIYPNLDSTGNISIALTNAINGVSDLVIVSAGNTVGTWFGYVNLSTGSNGGTPTTEDFVGNMPSLSQAATGMYALTKQGCALGVLWGLTDNASWSAQASFGLSNGVYMITSGPSGDTIASAVSGLASAGATSYALKVMFGDWCWWDDDTNGLMLIPPSIFAAGALAAYGPQNAALNKQLYGIVGSQKSGLASSGGSATYSDAELSALITGGIDVIANPAPGGAYWACRSGHNSASQSNVYSDSYTRLTNFFAESFSGSMGAYVGSVINATLFGDIRASLLGFLSSCLSQGILGSTTGALPYAVVCDSTNNPQARIAQGYVQADVQVQYQGINEKFIVNLQGGSSVTVTTSVAA